MNYWFLSFLSPLILIRYFLATWCIALVFLCSIIIKQQSQSKKLHEVKSLLALGKKIIARDSLAGTVIMITSHTVVIELASGQKKEIPLSFIEHVNTY